MSGDALKFFAVKCGGEDITKFYTDDGKPDITKARHYAEGVRKISPSLKVSQRVNRVRVTVAD